MSDKQPFIGGAVAMGVGKAVLPIVIKEILQRTVGRDDAAKVEREVARSPEAINQLNAEPLTKSRVVVGTSGAFLPAAGYLVWAISVNRLNLAGYDPSSTFLAVMTVIGAGYGLYGRIRGRLKPLGTK
jgi:hypothetical protein